MARDTSSIKRDRAKRRKQKMRSLKVFEEPKLTYDKVQGRLTVNYVEYDTWQEYVYCTREYPYGWHLEEPNGADLRSPSGHL